MSCLFGLISRPAPRYTDNYSSIELYPLPSVSRPSTSSSSSRSSSSNLSSRVSPQSAPTRSAASKAFSIPALHFTIRSWLGEELMASARVCREWRNFTPLAFRTYHRERTNLPLQHIINYFPRTSRTPSGILMYAEGNFSKLTSLDLSSADNTAVGNLIARVKAPALRELSLPRRNPLNVYVLSGLSKFERLTSLGLIFSAQVKETTLPAILAGCPTLTSLNFSYCPGINGAAVRKIGVSCPKLTSLDLSNCSEVRKAGLLAALAGCPNLASLNLSYCVGLNEPVTQAIDAMYPHLTSLDLSCSDVDDVTIIDIALRCPNLNAVRLNGCREVTSTALLVLAAQCPKLTSLHLRSCPGVDSVSIRALSTGCPHLSVLDLSRCSKVNKATLREIARECSNLASLHLSGCFGVNEAAVLAIVTKYDNYPTRNLRLTSLDLAFCPGVTPTSLREVTARCPNLTSLNVSGSNKEAIRQIAARCPNLTSLDLSGSKVNERILREIAARCRNLKALYLFNCDRPNDAIMRKITQHYPHLRLVF